MIMTGCLSAERLRLAKKAVRQAKNNGDVAVELLSKVIAEIADLRTNLAEMILDDLRSKASHERRLRREKAESWRPGTEWVEGRWVEGQSMEGHWSEAPEADATSTQDRDPLSTAAAPAA